MTTRELLLSTSPRSTWVWAASADEATAVRHVLAAARRHWDPGYRRGIEVEHVTDIDIGADAFGSLEALVAAGWAFRWHPTQEPMNRRPVQYGVPVAPAE